MELSGTSRPGHRSYVSCNVPNCQRKHKGKTSHCAHARQLYLRPHGARYNLSTVKQIRCHVRPLTCCKDQQYFSERKKSPCSHEVHVEGQVHDGDRIYCSSWEVVHLRDGPKSSVQGVLAQIRTSLEGKVEVERCHLLTRVSVALFTARHPVQVVDGLSLEGGKTY